MDDDFVNSSVPYARAFDADCPGGKAHYIVFFRQSDEAHGRPECDWVLERTSDGQIMANGTLSEMLALAGPPDYPHTRRATKAEDMLRFRFRIFEMEMGEPLRICRDTPRGINTPEVLRNFRVEPLPEGALPSYDKEPK